jgi:AcrR family transcriptional regulator
MAATRADGKRLAIQSDTPTRERILREAALLFRTRGFASTTMRNIAAASQLTPGALYWHFASKEAILYEIIVGLSDEWHAELAEAVAAPTPTERVRRFVRAQVTWELRLADEGHALLAMYGPDQLKQFLSPEQRAWVTGRQTEHFETVNGFIREGIEDGSFRCVDATTTAHAIYSIGSSVPRWWNPEYHLDVAALAAAHEDLVMRMLSAHHM